MIVTSFKIGGIIILERRVVEYIIRLYGINIHDAAPGAGFTKWLPGRPSRDRQESTRSL